MASDPWTRLRNPLLQILYDGFLVFSLDTAIAENRGHFVQGQWNQFRLFSKLDWRGEEKDKRGVRWRGVGRNGSMAQVLITDKRTSGTSKASSFHLEMGRFVCFYLLLFWLWSYLWVI